MYAPKYGKQLFIRDNCGIVIDPYRFTVITQIIISGIYGCAARISNLSTDNSFDTPKPGVGLPKSTQGKIGSLGIVMAFLIE